MVGLIHSYILQINRPLTKTERRIPMTQFGAFYCGGKAYGRTSHPIVTSSREIRLAWNYITTAVRNEVQKSYCITVSDEHGQTVHDTGVITSDAMQYAIPADTLRPGTVYHWRITAELSDGSVTSDAMMLETAIDDLDRAKWIICGAEDEPSAP